MAGCVKPMEMCSEFDEAGNPYRIRVEVSLVLPETPRRGDGAMAVLWQDNIAKVWFKDKKLCIIHKEEVAASDYGRWIAENDPKLLVKRLQHLEAQSKVKIEIQEPSAEQDLITLTATYLPTSSTPDKRLVILVDPETKLVRQIERHELAGDDYQFKDRIDIVGYNESIDPEVFTLDVPDGVMCIDNSALDLGLPKGNLTKNEIAVEVVRQYVEALIARDYAEAGRLRKGMPGDLVEKHYGKIKILRIISIGEPVLQKPGVRVPCVLEIDKDGSATTWPREYMVAPVRGQPNRWMMYR